MDIHGILGESNGLGYVPLVPTRVVDSAAKKGLTAPLAAGPRALRRQGRNSPRRVTGGCVPRPGDGSGSYSTVMIPSMSTRGWPAVPLTTILIVWVPGSSQRTTYWTFRYPVVPLYSLGWMVLGKPSL